MREPMKKHGDFSPRIHMQSATPLSIHVARLLALRSTFGLEVDLCGEVVSSSRGEKPCKVLNYKTLGRCMAS